MQHGDQFVTQHDRSSLRILGTVGEPINPHAWEWYHQVRQYNGGGEAVQSGDGGWVGRQYSWGMGGGQGGHCG
jgi:acyl-coenzyme A synthetase/AMP-(fatty) acid ligase